MHDRLYEKTALGRTGPLTRSRDTDERSFEDFFREAEPAVRYALVALYGYQIGREATADALAHSWENWSKIMRMDNPAGYVFRVGQRRALLLRRSSRRLTFDLADQADPTANETIDPELEAAIERLPGRQRQAVLLVYGVGWTVRQAAELLGVSAGTTQKHLERGLEKLRRTLGGDSG